VCLQLVELRSRGVPAPNAKMRTLVGLQGPDEDAEPAKPAKCEANCEHHRPVRRNWARLLKRVFEGDLEHYPNAMVS
jgi:hypothetical protein